MNDTLNQNEESQAQGSAGAPHNPPNQSGSDGSDGKNKTLTLPQKCAKAIGRIKRVGDIRTPKGLRNLKDEVVLCIDRVKVKIADLEAEASSGDQVDRLDCEDQVEVLKNKLVDLDKGPAAVNAHAEKLRHEREAQVQR
jgi:hypothetical protein